MQLPGMLFSLKVGKRKSLNILLKNKLELNHCYCPIKRYLQSVRTMSKICTLMNFLSVKKDKAPAATAPQGDGISSEMKLRAEEKSLVMAIRDTFLPRMQGRDASIFCTLITDIWPHVDLPLLFGGESPLSKPPQSRISSRARTAKSDNSARSLKGEKCVYFFFTTINQFSWFFFLFWGKGIRTVYVEKNRCNGLCRMIFFLWCFILVKQVISRSKFNTRFPNIFICLVIIFFKKMFCL